MAATITSGHVDFLGIAYDGGLEPHSHAHEHAVVDGVALGEDTEYAAGDLIVQVSGTGVRDVAPAWAPIGVAAGISYWTLAETPISGEPFVGIGAEELVATEWSTPINITLTGITAPAGGYFSLWQTDSFDVPTFYMSTLNGVSVDDSTQIAAAGHAHYGWGFTAIGDYELTFEFTGTHTSGAKTSTATYTISVIPEPSTSFLSLAGISLLLFRRTRK